MELLIKIVLVINVLILWKVIFLINILNLLHLDHILIQKMCLKNFTKLLPIKANKIRLTEEIYYKFRNWVTYGNNIKL